jgi:hypothetical protein
MLKVERNHCPKECEVGCSIHGTAVYPQGCKDFFCPYVMGEQTHRPDTFQKLLEELGGDMGNIIPAIPLVVPVVRAEQLIRKSRTVLANFLLDGGWKRTAIPLDRAANGEWMIKTEPLKMWNELCEQYGIALISEEEKAVAYLV